MVDLHTNEIHLWIVQDQESINQPLLDRYLSIISQDEAKRYRRFLFQRHQRQFLITRALVRTVLSQYIPGMQPEKLVFARNPHGKPRIASFGAPPAVHFNLSHAEGMVVLAVTESGELGVDVEYLTRQVDILRLAERFFSHRETSDLAALPAEEYNDRFFDLWTLKEAYIKACGQGLSIPLADFSFTFVEDRINISFAENRKDNAQEWGFWQISPAATHKMAVAIKGQNLHNTRLVFRRGIPLHYFEDCELEVFRSSWSEHVASLG